MSCPTISTHCSVRRIANSVVRPDDTPRCDATRPSESTPPNPTKCLEAVMEFLRGGSEVGQVFDLRFRAPSVRGRVTDPPYSWRAHRRSASQLLGRPQVLDRAGQGFEQDFANPTLL